MAGVLVCEDIALAPSPEEAEIIIVNTCAFIEEAREESFEMIRSACSLKHEGPCKAVLVAGCLPQRYKEKLKKTLPEVDAFIGLDEMEKVGEVVRRLASGEHNIIEISKTAKRLFEPRIPGIVFSGGPYAYLKVAEGCNHCCSFCAIPMIRGSYRSRPVTQLVKEAEQLLENGIKELNLISQDVTSYGQDLKDGTGLPELLHALGGLVRHSPSGNGGKFWIRLLYGHPSGVTDELLDVIVQVPQVCHYLDLPIQHSHPQILRAMDRAGTIDHVNTLVRRVRNVMPDAILRTTCLVGFPGERDEHFEHLLDFVRRTEFDHLGVFVFSPEENTKAFDLPDRPDPETAEERRKRLLLTQRAIVDKKAAGLIGTEPEVLLERPLPKGRGIWSGRSRRQAPEVDGEIFIHDVPSENKAGDFVKVRYTEQADYDIKAVYFQRQAMNYEW